MKILFTYTTESGFVQTDLDILRSMHEVRTVKFKPCLSSIIEIAKGVMWCDCTYSWFTHTHAAACVLFSKILRKKSIAIVGGYEVAKLPEINYGGMLSTKTAMQVKFVLNHADELICVSNFNYKQTMQYTDRNINLIYNCVDTEHFKPAGDKTNMVLTVVASATGDVKTRKGIDTFFEAAKQMPETQFVLVGKTDIDESTIPSNLKLTGYVTDKELLEYYQKAKVYCQLSYYESFGVAILEAMSCNCIPVVTNVAAIPEVVGFAGQYVEYGDVEATVLNINAALNELETDGPRKQALKFEKAYRKEKLELILELIGVK